MTAINIVCSQRHSIAQIVADAATYETATGIVRRFAPKVTIVSHWPGVITGRGNIWALGNIAEDIGERFWTFDNAVSEIESSLNEIISPYGVLAQNIELVICGWSDARMRPESYMICPSGDLPPGVTQETIDAGGIAPRALELMRLPNSVVGPMIEDGGAMAAAGFPGIDSDWAPARVRAGLRAAIEVQRRTKFDGGDGAGYWVGGFATLTIVTQDTVSESVLCRWPEDKIGERIAPLPIDWSRFRREQLQVVA